MSGYTQEQLDALKAAAARGVRSVSFDGQLVQFASIAEMLKMIAVIERDLNPRGPRIHYPSFERGT